MIERDVLKELNKVMARKEILALIGSRQVGKTTILNKLSKNLNKNDYEFISFENLEILNLFQNKIELFISKYVKNKKYLFIDEFQYAKNGGKQLKYLYDSFKIKILISGSSNAELAIQSLQFLVGRVFIYEIFPLSFREFLRFKSKENFFLFDEKRKSSEFNLIKPLFLEYLTYGGYPEVVKENNLEIKLKILKNLVNSYILKEIKDILGYKNLFEYENLLKRLALQDGKLLNKNSFSQDLGIYNNKISEMINILEKTFIIGKLNPFLKNKIKEQIKSPKVYFQDLGFKNALINNFNIIDLKSDKGEIYENFIYNQILRMGKNLNFYNIQNRHEMDFVLEENGQIIGIEIKSKIKNSSLSNSIIAFIDKFKPKLIYVFNEKVDSVEKYNTTKVIFTNYLNYFYLINKK